MAKLQNSDLSQFEVMRPYISPKSKLQPLPGALEVDPLEQEGRFYNFPAATPPLSAIEQLRSAYEGTPLRSDYQPSKKRTAGAAIAGGIAGLAQGGAAGAKVARGIRDAPFTDDYQDWLQRTGALERQAGLELTEAQINQPDLSGMASYYRAMSDTDPEAQRLIAQSTAMGKGEGEAPFVRRAADRATQNLREDYRSAEVIAAENSQAAWNRSEAAIQGRYDVAMERIKSMEGIAEMRNILTEKLGLRGRQIPPSQQYQARLIAENRVSRILEDDIEFKAFFGDPQTADDGSILFQLKSMSEILKKYSDDPEMLERYDQLKSEIENITNLIMSGRGYEQDQYSGGEVPD
jgi:hypothetical protein